jgi:hypothetical protein
VDGLILRGCLLLRLCVELGEERDVFAYAQLQNLLTAAEIL